MSEKNKKNTTKQTEKQNEKIVKFPKKETGLEVEIIDQNYRLGEMADAMDQSVANIKKLSKQQATLVSIISKSDKAKDFADFIKESEEMVDNYNNQISTLVIRSGLLKKVVEKCNENEEISKVVSMTLKALGVFEQR